MISLLMEQCRSQANSTIALHRILERRNSTSNYMKKLRAEVLQWMIMEVIEVEVVLFLLLMKIVL